jgi:hypothetical protein
MTLLTDVIVQQKKIGTAQIFIEKGASWKIHQAGT